MFSHLAFQHSITGQNLCPKNDHLNTRHSGFQILNVYYARLTMKLAGWMDGWVDGWMAGKAGLSIAYSNQK
jgi:hypothetical protein